MLSAQNYDLVIIDMNFYKPNPDYAKGGGYIFTGTYSATPAVPQTIMEYDAYSVLQTIRDAGITTPAVCASSETVGAKNLYEGGFDGFVLMPEDAKALQTAGRNNLYYWISNNQR